MSEAGQPKDVAKAGPATDPMRIALMLDTSDAAGPALNHMRTGAVALLDALPENGRFDLCYVNGGYHHIAPPERLAVPSTRSS